MKSACVGVLSISFIIISINCN